MKTSVLIALAAAAALGAWPALAQQEPKMHDHTMPSQGRSQGHGGHGASASATPGESAASAAFKAANATMHRDMDIALTGNVDVDFVRSMIPHHQGAIDMAKVVVAYGRDPAIKKLADEIIKAQEAEIAAMRNWLKSAGH
jgi:uncharacterized protein (DUF305 family)